jgi:IMP dehydrogenase
MFNKAYTFDDIALVPQYNIVSSRLTTNLETNLTRSVIMSNPLIPANMDTVISFELAEKVIENGGIPIFHRFCSKEQQLRFCKTFKQKCFVSCGVNDDEYNKLEELFNNGALGVCIDIAHGHSQVIIDLIIKIKTNFPYKQVIAGNICTENAYMDLVNAGADAVKVGVGPGAACTTRMVTGFGVPQFSAIYNIAKKRSEFVKDMQVPIIADGGIRNSRDVALALAAGANSVMIGNLFSKTLESGSKKYYKNENNDLIEISNILEIYEKFENNNDILGHYRGQASKNFQSEYFGKLKKGTVAEGIDFYTKCSGPVQQLYEEINGGLRSALTYGGATNISEFQNNAQFVEVTTNYIGESRPRENQ